MAEKWVDLLDLDELTALEEILLARILDRGLEELASRLFRDVKIEIRRRHFPELLLGDGRGGNPPPPFDPLGLSTGRGNGDAGSGISRRRLIDICLSIRQTLIDVLKKW